METHGSWPSIEQTPILIYQQNQNEQALLLYITTHMQLLERGEALYKALRMLELRLQSQYHPTVLDIAKKAAEAEVPSYFSDPYTAWNLAVCIVCIVATTD